MLYTFHNNHQELLMVLKQIDLHELPMVMLYLIVNALKFYFLLTQIHFDFSHHHMFPSYLVLIEEDHITYLSILLLILDFYLPMLQHIFLNQTHIHLI